MKFVGGKSWETEAVAFAENGRWEMYGHSMVPSQAIAFCANGSSLEDVIYDAGHTLAGSIAAAREIGVEPFNWPPPIDSVELAEIARRPGSWVFLLEVEEGKGGNIEIKVSTTMRFQHDAKTAAAKGSDGK